MHTFTSVVRRSSTFGVAVALLVATIVPAASAFADALNPLTERSLLLTSSAPGYMESDGSNNPETQYSPPGSGPNGKKTGETFKFKVSTDTTVAGAPDSILGISFQYCTRAAGLCQAPGNNEGDASADSVTGPRQGDSLAASQSDLNVNYTNPQPVTDFQIFHEDTDVTADWSMITRNAEDQAHTGRLTGKNNFIALVKTTGGGIETVNGDDIRIVFKASTTNYITNPGAGEFFVKINTYSTNDDEEFVDFVAPAQNTNIIDGGVTVANVMTHSIHITTKVLETMSFSVGTELRDAEDFTLPEGDPGPAQVHGTCDPIGTSTNNQLQLGNPNAEFSLETDTAWDVYSYWRLSSNSSGGATVYYSGDTLSNTVEDQIAPIGEEKKVSTPGTEQFGLAFVNDANLQADVSDSFEAAIAAEPLRYSLPTIDPLVQGLNYNSGNGAINGTPVAQFAFQRTSLTNPVEIASNTNAGGVLSCATAKMRYVANIGADTPAGVYTTKINYLAAPQY